MTVTRTFGILACFAGMGLIAAFASLELMRAEPVYYVPPAVIRDEAAPEPVPEPDTYYPVGVLISETPERLDYVDGDMHIYIPRLDLKLPVYAGVEDEDLNKGVGLFYQAQLPQSLDINSNTAIAGHRDVHGMEFYYIDTVTQGDPIYLTWDGNLYTYEVEDQFITNARDWDPIRTKEYPCITLQSCHPINIATDRIFVVGRLVDVTPGADFPTGEDPATDAPLDDSQPVTVA